MSISINIPFEELLKVIKNLGQEEKEKISDLLSNENVLSEAHLEEAMARKRAFENGELEIESWDEIKKRLLS